MHESADEKKLTGKVLYASYQESETLPGFIRYALSGLVQTGFAVVYLTNQRDLDPDSQSFLWDHHIELFFTENQGYDFGMWNRYLQYVAKFKREQWDRLILINDSIIYYQNRFRSLFDRCESSPADVVSLTCDGQYHFHLQSFFLYLKPRAIHVLYEHFQKTKVPSSFQKVILRMEVGLSQRMSEQGLSLQALYQTKRPVIFSYPELIRAKAGFVKRRLVEKRFKREEVFHFWEHGAAAAYKEDYARLIVRDGAMDSDFDKAWLITGPTGLGAMLRSFFRWVYFHIYWTLKQWKHRRRTGR